MRAVAEVYFDPDVYIVEEGNITTLTVKTNVTISKRFIVLVNTLDDSAISMYCICMLAALETVHETQHDHGLWLMHTIISICVNIVP